MISNKKVLSLIVTYNPEVERFNTCLEKISGQVDKVLVIDNNSSNISSLEQVLFQYSNIELLKNTINLGLSKAYNKALKYARENKFDFLLILDQDTICSNNLIQEYKKYANTDYAALSPLRHHHNKDYEEHNYRLNKYDKPNGNIELIPFTINSGTCINLNVLPSNYYYDEKLFLEFLEHDFCLFLKQNHFKLARINSAEILVDIGNLKKHIVWKYDWYSKNYSTHRLKINARDFIIFLKKNWRKNPKFVNSFIIATLWMYWMIMFEKNRLKKYIAIFQGLFLGIFSKSIKNTQ